MLDDQQNERRRVQGRDPRAFYQGMNEGRLAQGSMDAWVMALRSFFRLVTLPIWLPYKVGRSSGLGVRWPSLQRREEGILSLATAR